MILQSNSIGLQNLEAAKAELKRLLLTIEGIGQVTTEAIILHDEKKWKEQVMFKGLVNIISFTQNGFTRIGKEKTSLIERRTKWSFNYYYTYNPKISSQTKFDAVCATLIDEINRSANDKLNSVKLQGHSGIDLTQAMIVNFNGTIVHLGMFEMFTFDAYINK